jgi:ankyrin repeat protein
MLYAAILKCCDVLRTELGADINQTKTNGIIALQLAASRGQPAVMPAVMRCLVELGAEVGTVALNCCGCTALLVSARNGHNSTMSYFLEEVRANMDDVNNMAGAK